MPSCGSRPPGRSGLGSYAATKAAIRSPARTWAAEPAGRGIRVNALPPPGPVATPGGDGLRAAFPQGGQATAAPTPLRRADPARPSRPPRRGRGHRPLPGRGPGFARSGLFLLVSLVGVTGAPARRRRPAASFLDCQAPTTTSTWSV
ncbi:hypothetical protein GCM10010317_089090 [Streptomyces mirabilis]|uniref:SDR family NAD(P)-dependent oxidoreductase n=1 Tax=Streptomyces mirabilis TaxID=68239 RepID=UPI00198992DA|nr:hypothetical protein GCM10010317_089090 [Streptomyces mirabilis]